MAVKIVSFGKWVEEHNIYNYTCMKYNDAKIQTIKNITKYVNGIVKNRWIKTNGETSELKTITGVQSLDLNLNGVHILKRMMGVGVILFWFILCMDGGIKWDESG